MAKLRTCLYLALALLVASLTCDLGAGCTVAGMAGSCCQVTPQDGASDVGFAGGVAPGIPELAVSTGKGERSAAAVATASPVPAAHGFSASAAAPAPSPGCAASTPLYLSHCAFLC